jgi:alanine racemase
VAGKYRKTAQMNEFELAAVEPEFEFSVDDLSPGGDLLAVVIADRYGRDLTVAAPSAARNSQRFGVRDVAEARLSAMIHKKFDSVKFRSASSWRAIADRIQTVVAGESVDFGCTWSVRRSGQLAAKPGGAASGFSVVVATGCSSSYMADLSLSRGGYAWAS